MTPSRTCSSENGSIIRCSFAMRRIQRSDFTDICPPSTSPKGFHGGTYAATRWGLDGTETAGIRSSVDAMGIAGRGGDGPGVAWRDGPDHGRASHDRG